jgi:hypothetical protein
MSDGFLTDQMFLINDGRAERHVTSHGIALPEIGRKTATRTSIFSPPGVVRVCEDSIMQQNLAIN